MNRPSHAMPGPLQAAAIPEVANHTPWPAQYFQHVDPRGEAFHVMVSRVSYSLAEMTAGDGADQPVLLSPQAQLPLCEADVFRGEPNVSSTVQESDFAPYKPRCDVLLVNASAYAPGGKPMRRWPVGLRFGDTIRKVIEVTGPRWYRHGVSTLGTLQLTEPEPTLAVSIDYERAFGGPNLIVEEAIFERYAEQAPASGPAAGQARVARDLLEKWPAAFLKNPIGCGRKPEALLKGRQDTARLEAMAMGRNQASVHEAAARRADIPAPQVEAWKRPFHGETDYPVVGFGPVGRWWEPRARLAGTHDDAWKMTQWPKSPTDHDYGYWNCAPEDQQIDFPHGGEEITLVNLTPRPARDGGPVRFSLPQQDMQLLVRLHVGAMMFAPMHIDTIILDMEAATLSVVRRATLSARTDVRRLELGTWPHGTAMELTAADKAEARRRAGHRG